MKIFKVLVLGIAFAVSIGDAKRFKTLLKMKGDTAVSANFKIVSICGNLTKLNANYTKKTREIYIKNQREKSRDLRCCEVMDMIVQ